MIFNSFAARFLPVVEMIVLVLHLVGFVAILVTLWVLSPRNDTSVGFGEYNNGGEWPTLGLSLIVGMLSAAIGLFGKLYYMQ